MFVLNGLPRSGNHALQKACALLGVELRVEHYHYSEKVPGWKYLYVTRNPRSMAVAACRAPKPHVATPEGIIAQIREYRYIMPLADLLADRAMWLVDPDVHAISYEELTGSPAGIERLAGLLGVMATGGEFAKLPGGTLSWTGGSDGWQAYWTDAVEAVWQESGCAAYDEVDHGA